MIHRIKITELCKNNNISSKEQAELIIKEIKNVLDLYLEVILSFKGVTNISIEASTIIRNYIYDNKLEECVYIINMSRYVRQIFFWGHDSKKEIDEKEMNNTNQKELSKFGKKFLDFMNNRGGAQGFVIFGLTGLAILIGPYVIQTFNLMTSDMNTASKIIVIFGFVCVVVALICLIKMLIFVGKNTNFFK